MSDDEQIAALQEEIRRADRHVNFVGDRIALCVPVSMLLCALCFALSWLWRFSLVQQSNGRNLQCAAAGRNSPHGSVTRMPSPLPI